ncbi:Hypothetical_protein [Hexamita inflata]|uniref:Hypothetical_protein n=1 Tax=Hexamita inflata TaxID=28002 RepID=A0AA86U2Z2_9EUKA|nr:Hypothetical protein HINF_LOCUS27825 [Hexamita inflata]
MNFPIFWSENLIRQIGTLINSFTAFKLYSFSYGCKKPQEQQPQFKTIKFQQFQPRTMLTFQILLKKEQISSLQQQHLQRVILIVPISCKQRDCILVKEIIDISGFVEKKGISNEQIVNAIINQNEQALVTLINQNQMYQLSYKRITIKERTEQ